MAPTNGLPILRHLRGDDPRFRGGRLWHEEPARERPKCKTCGARKGEKK